MSNARFSITQSAAVEDKRLSSAQFRTLAALGVHGDKEGWCFPKLATFGKKLGKSKQAVSKDIQKLKELGYLEVHPQFREDGSQKHNLYRIVFDAPPQPVVDAPSTPEIDPPSTPEVDALTPHSNAPYELKDILSVWKELFPNKPQPRPTTKSLQAKIRTRIKDSYFVDNWEIALQRASNLRSLQAESWFDLAYFLRSDDTWQNCLDNKFFWKEKGYPTQVLTRQDAAIQASLYGE